MQYRLYWAQTPSDAPWTESPHIKIDDSSVLGYDALTRLEDWAANEAPLMFDFDFDQASLFSGFVYSIVSRRKPKYSSRKVKFYTKNNSYQHRHFCNVINFHT